MANDLKVLAVLAAAQLEFEPIVKDATNPAYKRDGHVSKYATLGSVIDTVRPTLRKHGLFIVQKNIHVGTDYGVSTRLIHLESGEEITSEFLAPLDKQSSQGVASGQTYARRYEYLTILGLTTEDDDGNAASGVTTRPQSGQPAAKGTKPQQPSKTASPQSKKPAELPNAAIAAKLASDPAPAPPTPVNEDSEPAEDESTQSKPPVTFLPTETPELATKEELGIFYTRAKAVSATLIKSGWQSTGSVQPGAKLVSFITKKAGVAAMPAIPKVTWEALLGKLETLAAEDAGKLISLIEGAIK